MGPSGCANHKVQDNYRGLQGFRLGVFVAVDGPGVIELQFFWTLLMALDGINGAYGGLEIMS